MSSEGFDDVGLRYVGGRWVWLEFDSRDQVEASRLQDVNRDIFGRSKMFLTILFQMKMCLDTSWSLLSCDRVLYSFILLILWKKDAEGPSLDESLENEEHLDVDSCDSDSPKNVNNDSVSPSSRVLREEDVRGVESDLVDSFEEGEIRDDSVLSNVGCIKDAWKRFGSVAG
ncbi:hypothetical protein Tco_0756449 [Tanacetum coccineum]